MSNLSLPKSPNSGTYREIWDALKNNTQRVVVVNCPHDHMETLIQAVKKVKSGENVARKAFDAPHWGRLIVEKDVKKGTVSFSLTYALEDIE